MERLHCYKTLNSLGRTGWVSVGAKKTCSLEPYSKNMPQFWMMFLASSFGWVHDKVCDEPLLELLRFLSSDCDCRTCSVCGSWWRRTNSPGLSLALSATWIPLVYLTFLLTSVIFKEACDTPILLRIRSSIAFLNDYAHLQHCLKGKLSCEVFGLWCFFVIFPFLQYSTL